MHRRLHEFRHFIVVTLALTAVLQSCAVPESPAELESVMIGLAASRAPIEAVRVAAGDTDARRVVLLGGLNGADASSDAIAAAVATYAGKSGAERPVELLAVPVANSEASALVFPPAGRAYSENTESYSLWRWLGLTAPDLVLVVGQDPAGLAAALAANDVAGVGSIPARQVENVASLADALDQAWGDIEPSPARLELERRRSRTPSEFADQLSPIYGQNFDPPIYTDGMALIAHLGLGNFDHVESLVEPYVDGSRDSLASPFGVSTLVLAGHLVFAELAELTDDARYLARARAAAELSFDEDGRMLEAVPNHGEMSDAIFMGASILAAVGELTGEQRFFDMAVRQIDFMNELVHRDDGLYRHSPLTDAAWGRGNGFAAIGYALTLSKLPETHPDYLRLVREYQAYMATLAEWQNMDGSFSQVIGYPGSYHETSSTAIIGFSMQRGVNRGWLDAGYQDNAARAFEAVLTRTDFDGRFIDVSESTNKQQTLDNYLMREALFGRDNRTGSFAMLFAVERIAAKSDD